MNNREITKIDFHRKVSFKFIIYVFLSTFIVFFISAIWQINYVYKQKMNFLHNHANLLASSQAGALSTPLWNIEDIAINSILSSFSADSDFISASVLNEKGEKKFFHGSKETKNSFTIKSPIIYSGEKIGDLEIIFSYTNIQKEKLKLTINILIQSAISMLTMLVSCLFCLRMIISPLGQLQLAMNELASGKMDIDTALSQRPDELGAIACSVENFKLNLIEQEKRRTQEAAAIQRQHTEDQKNLIQKLAHQFEATLGDIVNSVSSAATELNANAENLTNTSYHTASQAEEVTAASRNALTIIENVSDSSNSLLGSITHIAQQINQSYMITRQAVTNAVHTKETIGELMEMANNIGSVIKLISEIAEQTNLLALNATIEAARAGEAGRGFVVVANEVKQLANQTAKATSAIAQQIQSIQGSTQNAVEAINQISTTIEQINDISEMISAAVEEQTVSTSDISHGINEIATSSNQIKQNIGHVAENADHSRQYSREVQNAAADLAQKSELLRKVLNDFVASLRS